MSRVLVVGAGVAGLGAALMLERRGHEVVLIEADGDPPPVNVDDALTGWDRSGVPQFSQGHAIHALARLVLQRTLPDVLKRAVELGARELLLTDRVPDSDQSAEPDLVVLLTRRSTLEWVLREAVSSSNIAVQAGYRAVGLLAGAGHEVKGVLLSDGSEVRADWVIDATGRRSQLDQWVKPLGLALPAPELQPSNTLYYSRHFRVRPGRELPDGSWVLGPTGDVGYLRYSVLPEDCGGFVITLNSPTSDSELRVLKDVSAWDAAANQFAALRPWLDGDRVIPISPVSTMGGLQNSWRPAPRTAMEVACGVIAIGDALCHTNPTQGWGVSFALRHAERLVQALPIEHDAATARHLTWQLWDEFSRSARPYFDVAAGEDRARASLQGRVPAEGWPRGGALFFRKVVYPVAISDAELFIAAQRRVQLLDPVDALPARADLLQRAEVLAASRQQPPQEPEISRDVLLDVMQSALARPALHPERANQQLPSKQKERSMTKSTLEAPAPALLPKEPRLSPVELMRAYAASTADERVRLGKEVSDATQNLIDRTGRGLDLTETDLTGLDLTGLDLRRASLSRATLHSTKLMGADLSEITMICPAMERTNLSGASLRAAYVHALAAQTCNFDGADLTGLRDATGTLFHGCSMRGVQLSGSQLAGSTFYQCDLSETDLTDANLQGAVVNECLLDSAVLIGACVDQTVVTKSSVRGASFVGASGRGLVLQRLTSTDGLDLSGAELPRLRVDGTRGHGWNLKSLRAVGADFTDVYLAEATLAGVDLTGAHLRECALPGANLEGALLTNAKITGSTLRGARLVGAHGENLALVESDLTEADLSGFTGRCLTARDVNLHRAVLRGANLYRAMLTGDPPRAMDMRGADLENAILVQAYIAADLREAQLTGANCAYSRFSQSDLAGARLDGANMYQSTWVKVNLVGASVRGVRAPIFVDRCPGLAEALARCDDSAAAGFNGFREGMGELLATLRKGST